ncbi:MAG: hypothetical protein KGZ59_01915 [Chitinophagaceae bacterium]|nr:hypothetical protein [Chitinophagaceae bacterium]
MLDIQEEKFIKFWSEKRNESKLNPFFFIKGFAGGLIIGLLVFISILAGWYKRANMDASNKLSPTILFICILSISLFIAIFYNYFKYEQNEQLYQELIKRKEKNQKKIQEN